MEKVFTVTFKIIGDIDIDTNDNIDFDMKEYYLKNLKDNVVCPALNFDIDIKEYYLKNLIGNLICPALNFVYVFDTLEIKLDHE